MNELLKDSDQLFSNDCQILSNILYGNNENMDLSSKGSHLKQKNVKYGNMNVKFVKSFTLVQ